MSLSLVSFSESLVTSLTTRLIFHRIWHLQQILPASAACNLNSSSPRPSPVTLRPIPSSSLSNLSESESIKIPSFTSLLSLPSLSSAPLLSGCGVHSSRPTSEPPTVLSAMSRSSASSASVVGRWERPVVGGLGCLFERKTAVKLARCVVLMLSCRECSLMCLFIVLMMVVLQP